MAIYNVCIVYICIYIVYMYQYICVDDYIYIYIYIHVRFSFIKIFTQSFKLSYQQMTLSYHLVRVKGYPEYSTLLSEVYSTQIS